MSKDEVIQISCSHMHKCGESGCGLMTFKDRYPLSSWEYCLNQYNLPHDSLSFVMTCGTANADVTVTRTDTNCESIW